MPTCWESCQALAPGVGIVPDNRATCRRHHKPTARRMCHHKHRRRWRQAGRHQLQTCFCREPRRSLPPGIPGVGGPSPPFSLWGSPVQGIPRHPSASGDPWCGASLPLSASRDLHCGGFLAALWPLGIPSPGGSPRMHLRGPWKAESCSREGSCSPASWMPQGTAQCCSQFVGRGWSTQLELPGDPYLAGSSAPLGSQYKVTGILGRAGCPQPPSLEPCGTPGAEERWFRQGSVRSRDTASGEHRKGSITLLWLTRGVRTCLVPWLGVEQAPAGLGRASPPVPSQTLSCVALAARQHSPSPAPCPARL